MLLCSLFTVVQELKLNADKSPKLELCTRQGSHKTSCDFQKMLKRLLQVPREREVYSRC